MAWELRRFLPKNNHKKSIREPQWVSQRSPTVEIQTTNSTFSRSIRGPVGSPLHLPRTELTPFQQCAPTVSDVWRAQTPPYGTRIRRMAAPADRELPEYRIIMRTLQKTPPHFPARPLLRRECWKPSNGLADRPSRRRFHRCSPWAASCSLLYPLRLWKPGFSTRILIKWEKYLGSSLCGSRFDDVSSENLLVLENDIKFLHILKVDS